MPTSISRSIYHVTTLTKVKGISQQEEEDGLNDVEVEEQLDDVAKKEGKQEFEPSASVFVITITISYMIVVLNCSLTYKILKFNVLG